MEKRTGQKLISFLLVVCQILGWSQASFAAPNFKINPNTIPLSAVTDFTGKFGAWYQLPKGVTFGGAALEGVFVGAPKAEAELKLGLKIRTGEATVPLTSKAGVAVGQINLPPMKKVNAVTKLRQMALKAGKFSTLTFGMEAFTFFVALGVLSKYQLSSSFADNPVSWQQHLAANDPTTPEGRMGYISFYAFMVGSRGCGIPLHSMAAANQKMMPWISYAEMACGFLASNIYQEAMRFPELQQCVASLETRTKQDEEKWATCERAYDSWSDVGWEKSQQMVPSLFAMMLSTGLAGFAEKFTTRPLLTLAGWQVVFDPSIKIASWFTPAGASLRVVRFLYKVGQFVAFTKTQSEIEPDIKQFFQNLWDGTDLHSLENVIMYQLYEKKRSGWKDPVPYAYSNLMGNVVFEDLNLSLTKLSQLGMEWRKGTIAELIARHQYWMQYVSSFSQTYTAAMLFYDHYINEYRNRFISRKPSLLNAPYLLSGIEPVMPESGPQPNEYYSKTDYEYRQIRSLIEARQKMEELLKANEEGIERNYPKYLPEVRKFLALLPTAEDYQKGRLNYGQYAMALEHMNKQLGITFDPGAPWSQVSQAELQMKAQSAQAEMQAIAQSDDLSANEKKERTAKIQTKLVEELAKATNNANSFEDGRYLYSEFRKMLGDPKPLRQQGIGFLKAYEQGTAEKNNLAGMPYPQTEMMTDRLNNSGKNSVYSALNTALSFLSFVDEDSTPITSHSNTINYLHPSQYLAAQIALGPRADLKQPLVVMSKRGFPARFMPPRLVDSYSYDFKFNEMSAVSSDSRATIFNTPVLVGTTKAKYPNLYAVLTAPTVLPGILNHKDGFAGWWKDYVEAQYIYAWNKFENEYQEIMVGMLEHYKYSNPGISFDTFGSWIETSRRNGLSVSPLSGGLQLAFRQERRLHLLILGEMLKDMASSLPKDSPLLKLGQANPTFNASEHPLKFTSVAGAVDDKKFLVECKDQYNDVHEQMACVKKKKHDTGGGLAGIEVLLTGSTKEYNQNLKQFVPALEILKSSEQYSLASILDGYKGQLYHGLRDPYAKNHFAFQDQVEKAFVDLEALMDQMQVTDVQSQQFRMSTASGVMEFPTTPKIVVSKITNQNLRDAQTKIEDLVNQLEEQFKQAFEKSHPEILPIVLADMRGLKTVAEQTAEIGRMVNAVSYDRSDEKAQQKGEDVCDKNVMITTKIGLLGNRAPFSRKACTNMKKQCADVQQKVGQADAGVATEIYTKSPIQETAPKQTKPMSIQPLEFEKEFFETKSPSKGDKQPVVNTTSDVSPDN